MADREHVRKEGSIYFWDGILLCVQQLYDSQTLFWSILRRCCPAMLAIISITFVEFPTVGYTVPNQSFGLCLYVSWIHDQC